MYVCICNAVTDKQIRRAADAGARDLRDLRQQLGVATGCGQCATEACRVLDDRHRATGPVGDLDGDLLPAPA